MTTAEIGYAGERHVEAWLRSKNYVCHPKAADSSDIEGIGTTGSVLVRVMTGQAPNAAPEISAEERLSLIERAAKLGRTAYLARVQIDERGRLLGTIGWTRLPGAT